MLSETHGDVQDTAEEGTRGGRVNSIAIGEDAQSQRQSIGKFSSALNKSSVLKEGDNKSILKDQQASVNSLSQEAIGLKDLSAKSKNLSQ